MPRRTRRSSPRSITDRSRSDRRAAPAATVGLPMRYIPQTEAEVRAMLAVIGVGSIDALFEPVPEKGRLSRELAIETACDEVTLMSHLEELSVRNDAVRAVSFLGAGIYDHHVPPMVDQMLT